ncbi:non-ribosomal peptide synthase/polyketide synthase [Massilia endophytica]|uniref:non-ribosomal peptide synthase/polyketide synthase n=1 Tax=Massilia endophytica TaxID=2899220 RepID=UPI001E2DD446|nr:non-ribosomal peptide synthase/polyketide synthase [Massilia endophytica]UGQ48692.1 non-ribosomal peptide synthase/polyketide synthase [Massilia endophytica]
MELNDTNELNELQQELIALLMAEAAENGKQGPCALPAGSREGLLPASFAQERLWFIDQLERDAGTHGAEKYLAPIFLRLRGQLDTAALHGALNALVARHEVLRTTLHAGEAHAMQKVHPASPIDFPLVDLGTLDAEVQASRLREEIAALSAAPFALDQGPLLRARLVRLDEEHHALLVIQHHIVSDGWSRGILLRELSALYAALRASAEPSLPQLPFQYADFAAWQRNPEQSARITQQLDYWTGQLAGLPPLLTLPTDRPRPPVQGNKGGRHRFGLSPELSKALKSLAQKHGATLFMVLSAAYALLLSRHSGQTDLAFGTPIANRNLQDLEGLIGLFANTLVLRADVAAAVTADDLVAQMKNTCLAAFDNQDLPFEQLVGALNPERSRAYSPIFQTMFVLQNNAEAAYSMDGLSVTPLDTDQLADAAKYDLTLTMGEQQGVIDGVISYAADLFDAETIESMAARFVMLLEVMAATPSRPLAGIDILTPAERQRLLQDFAHGAPQEAGQLFMHQLFEEQARLHPEAAAVEHCGQTISYAELNRRANRLAHHLHARGASGTLVGICFERTPDLVTAILAIMKAGAAYVPLDPAYPAERLAFMAEDAALSLILTQDALANRLPSSTAQILRTDTESWSCEAEGNLELSVNADQPAYLIYTSGSTGKPKGVQLHHGGLRNLVMAQSRGFHLETGSRVLQFASPSFDAAVSEIGCTLASGATLVLASREELMPGEALHGLLASQRITHVTLPPAALALTPSTGLPDLKVLVTAGDACAPALVAQWSQGRRMINAYGPTENTVCATMGELRPGQALSIGRPVPGVSVYILDAHGNPVPQGVAGELHIGGVQVAHGYLRRESLTREKFVPDPFGGVSGATMYRSGDLARWLPDGNIDFLGRIDFQVKLRGFRIEPGEIENLLCAQDGVREALVMVREDRSGEHRLVAYVRGEACDTQALRNQLKSQLPEYMVPAAVIALDTFPLTPNGKVDRKALPAPEFGSASFIAPVTPAEVAVAEAARQVLQLPRISMGDSFFDLGGHSLLATQLVSRLRASLGVPLGLGQLFATPVLGELAKVVETLGSTARLAPIPLVPRGQPLPASFAQERLWFLDQFDRASGGGASAAYLVPVALRLRGALDVAALRRALQTIVDRHETLRTSVVSLDGAPAQVVAAQHTLELPLADLSVRSASEREEALKRHLSLEIGRGFDLATAPLLRAALLRLAHDEHVLTITMHHIVSDGWSVQVLTRELAALYAAYIAGASDPLPPLPLQYADFAAWQRSPAQAEALDRQRSYWVNRLAGSPPLLTLPTDRPRPAVQTHAGACHSFVLPGAVAQGIQALSQRLGATPFMTLSAAFAVLLGRHSGQDDLVFGTPVANRNRQDIEGLIGFFANTLVLRADLSGVPRFSDLVAQMKQTCLEAYDNQDLPFEQLVSAINPERSTAYSPLYQVTFSLHSGGSAASGLAGLEAGSVDFGTEGISAKFDLGLTMSEQNGTLSGIFDYNTDLFDAATIEAFGARFGVLLEAICADADQAPHALPMLAPGERELLLERFNHSHLQTEAGATVHGLFMRQAELNPEACAIASEAANLSYGELARLSRGLAAQLQALGVEKNPLVAVCCERSPEMVIAMLAVLRAGGAYVPIDPAYPADRIAYMLENTGATVLLTQSRLGIAVPPSVRHIVDVASAASGEALRSEGDTDVSSLANVIFTSGSTGLPKGVMVPHRALANHCQATIALFGLGAKDRVLQFAAPGFDMVGEEVWPTLASGATLVLRPSAQIESMSEFTAWAAKEGLTVMNLPASFWTRWTESLAEPDALPALRLMVAGSEEVSPQAVRAWQALFGTKKVLLNAYGPTEATITSASHRIPLLKPDEAIVPIGRPAANTRIYLLDAHGGLVPPGCPGGLHIAGVQVAAGYLKRPELDAQVFLRDPFGQEDARMYRSGDLARWRRDGTLEYLGRADSQVKIRGFRIEPGEIEQRLAAFPGVSEALVLARPSPRGDMQLVAYVAGTGIEREALRTALKSALPDYMIPAAFVLLDAFPQTANGKIDRKALPDPEMDSGATFEAPEGETEELLAGLWAEVLKLERVGRHDNFFELGGHSLLAVSLIERMRRQGVQADVRTLFATPTIAALAAASGGQRSVQVPPNLIPPGCERITPDMLPLVALSQADIDMVAASVPGGAGNIQDIYPLAPLQEGMLFHHMLESEGDVYLGVQLAAFANREELDAHVAALRAVIARHDIMRSAVVWEGLPEPVQVVWREAPLALHELEFDSKNGPVADQLRAHCDPQRKRLEVRQAPMMQLFAAHDTANARWLLLTWQHHLLGDHTTMDVLHEEIQAWHDGRLDELPRPIPFRNFVAQTRLGITREEHEAFFRSMLGDVDTPTAPFGMLDVMRNGSQSMAARRMMGNDLAQRVRAASRKLGVGAASLCHLAWALVLSKLTGNANVVFGTVLFGRMDGGDGADRNMGLFINTLPFRVTVDGAGVADSLQRTHRALAGLLRHEHAPLALAQRCSAVQAPLPLFSTMFNYRHSKLPAQGAAPENGAKLLSVDERSNFPLSFAVDDLGERFGISAKAEGGIDPERICDLMESALGQIASSLENGGAEAVEGLDILPAQERSRVLDQFNATSVSFPAHGCVHEMVEAQARRTPDAIAAQIGDATLSYAELNLQANRLAHHLQARGVGPDVLVAVCAERSLEMIVALLAVLKAGGAYVPIDPAYPAERIAFLLADTRAALLLTQQALLPTLPAPPCPALCLDTDAAAWADASGHDPAPVAGPSNLAYVIYTSGSTGTPKGVMVEHRSLRNFLLWKQDYLQLKADDRILQKTAFAFDGGLWEFWSPLLCGARLVFARPGGHADPAYLVEAIAEHQITTVKFIPTMLALICEEPDLARCTSLRHVICGGEALSEEVARTFFRRMPHLPLHNLFGPTETTIDVTAWTARADDAPGRIPIGRPIANTRAYVLDRQGGLAPVGVPGELYIGGIQVARGYLNQPALTDEKFLPDPFDSTPGARMYRTGDRARWLPDGAIDYMGRSDFQVKIRGFRIELGEIESRLASHPSVREALVMAREDQPGVQRLVAYVTVRAGEVPDAALLRAHLQETLPEYMVPSAFMVLDVFPLTPNGKIDRKALPVPEVQAGARYIAPRTLTEQAVADAVTEVLKCGQPSMEDSFFELGGHSLLATQLVSRIRRRLGAELSLAQLFATPVLGDLARAIDAAKGAASQAPILPQPRSQALPASFAQERLWFLDQFEGAGNGAAKASYVIPMALRLQGRLDVGCLHRALQAIVDRHEPLRTAIVSRDGQAVQAIATQLALPLPLTDLGNLPPNERKAALQRHLLAQVADGFALDRSPLIRAELLRLGEDEHVLSVTMHHIVSDGWSMGILVRELGALYTAFLEGGAASLPPLAIQYADYAAWQRSAAQAEVLERQLEHWARELDGLPPLLTLPTDRPRPAVRGHAGAVHSFELTPALSARLRQLSQKHGATLFMTLSAAFSLLLSRHSGQDDVAFGTPIANRNRHELENLIGFFANTLVIRNRIDAAASFETLLAQTRNTCLAAYDNQDLPFEQLVTALNPERSTAYSPLFQVMFVLRNNADAEFTLPGLKAGQALEGSEDSSINFDLTLSMSDGDTLGGRLAYNIELFDAATVERMAQRFVRLLDAAAAAPALPLAELDMLAPEEWQQLLGQFSHQAPAFAAGPAMHELFERQAARRPQATALQMAGQAMSYVELNRKANQLARHLRSLGIGEGQLAGVCFERGMDMVVAILAIMKAGGAYVPLDPSYPAERIAFMASDADLPLVLTSEALLQVLPQDIPALCCDRDAAQWRDQPDENLDGAPAADSRAYVIYTSGSTGLPKGVQLHHGGLRNLVLAQIEGFGIDENSRVLQFASSSFDAAVSEIGCTLAAGATLVLASRDEIMPGEPLARLLAAQRVSHATLPPAALSLTSPDGLQALRVLVTAGEACPAAVAERWGAGRRMINAYGPTEATVCATMGDLIPGSAVTIGRPLPGARIYLLDPHGQPVPQGVAGELHIGGVQVAMGYLNRPELNAERFLPDPFSSGTGARMYRSGDLARWLPDGRLEFLGRADFQVKLRGFRIELGEIENSVAGHPSVQEVLVMVREDQPGDKRLTAYVRGDAPDSAVLRAWLKDRLPDYMLPSAIVVLEAFPLTANGKIDRKALPKPEAQSGAAFVAPQGETETMLAALWADVLKAERVGRHDNFFELGGHSLLAVSLIERMRRQGVQADVRTLFATPTIAALAAAAGSADSQVEVPPNLIPADCRRITPDMLPLVTLQQADIDAIAAAVEGGMANIQDIYPLAPLQEGILFHYMLAEEGDVYLGAQLAAFDSREQLDAHIGALRKVIARHDILRTAVLWEGLPQPVQVVWRDVALEVEELSFDPSAGPVADQLRARCNPQRNRLDVRKAPMMHIFAAHDPGNGRWLMLVWQHHMLGDHTTMHLLDEEIAAFHAGRGHELPPAAPFRNFVATAKLGISESEHEDYFRAMLGDVDETTAPFGLSDVQGDGSAIQVAWQRTGADLGIRLRNVARKAGVSTASLFHLAWAQVLAVLSGREDVVFGTVLFGRMQAGESADRTMGLFINTLPLKVSLRGRDAATALRQAHDALSGLLRHEHASLALAQRCSGVPRGTPLFSSVLNYRHAAVSDGGDAPNHSANQGLTWISGQERSNYPVSLIVDDIGSDFVVSAHVDASESAQRVCSFVCTALEALAAALEQGSPQEIGALGVLPALEREQLLVQFNAVPGVQPSPPLHAAVEIRAAAAPDAIALEWQGQRCSYAEINARVNRLARHLRKAGVQDGALTGIAMERGMDAVIAILAVMKAGGAYVPLDPSYPQDRLDFMLQDSGLKVLLTHSDLAQRFAVPAKICLDSDAALWDGNDAGNPGWPCAPQGRAYVIYTSGSTGQPKGVLLHHEGLCNMAAAQARLLGLEPGSRVLQFASLSFDAAVWEIAGALSSGATLVLAPREELMAGEMLAATLRKARISHATLPPAVLTLTPAENLPDLQVLVSAGEACPPAMLAAWAPGRRFINAYGPTEATVCVSGATLEADAARIHIGGPTANTRLYILDRHGNPAPVGIAGELHAGGPQIAHGYLNRPQLTAEKFIPDPFSEGRLYRTGDLARWLPDGTIDYLGRTDFQVKLRGFRIEPGEIEHRLVSCEGVQEAYVMLREDREGDRKLVAYVTGQAQAAELRSTLAAQLPDYMVPAAIVTLDRLPLTPNGKIDRKALPAPDHGGETGGYKPPRNPLEWQLAEIWESLLGTGPVGIHDDFFALGGHSLTAVRLVGRLKADLGAELPLNSLFEHPTIARLGGLLADSAPSGHTTNSCLVPLKPEGSQRPLYVVHALGGTVFYYADLARFLGPDQPVYALQSIGQFGEAEPLASVEAMAAHYVAALRDHQPQGPYRLLGYSSGGSIAFEMAHCLRELGEEVEFVGLVDAFLASDQMAVPHSPRWIKTLGTMVYLKIDEEEVAAIPEADRLPWFIARCRRDGAITPGKLEDYLQVIIANLQATTSYRPRPLDAALHIFTQHERVEATWSSLSSYPLHVLPVPGEHSTLMQRPHVQHVAAAVSHSLRSAGEVQREASAGETPDCLVMLQPGATGVAPVFLVPGAGASVAGFAHLAHALGPTVPVYALQASGLDGGAPSASVQLTAARYVAAILPVLKDHPLQLAGHSFGAKIAFEMALQLKAAGRSRAPLALIDASGPYQVAAPLSQGSFADSVLRLALVLEEGAGRPMGIDAAALAGLSEAPAVALLHEKMASVGLISARVPLAPIQAMARVFHANLNTLYAPARPYPDAAVLLMAANPSAARKAALAADMERLAGEWRSYAPALKVLQTPGNHMTLMDKDHAASLAAMLQGVWQEGGQA